MINTLYLPELREMLETNDRAGLEDFCTALHPARTAEFMEGLTAEEAIRVLEFAEPQLRSEIFSYLETDHQVEIVNTHPPAEASELIGGMSTDDQVDLLQDVDDELVKEILSHLPPEERRDVMRLSRYPEGTAGSIMTTEMAKLSKDLTVREALGEISRQAEELETVYCLYIVDEHDSLHGVVSTRQLVSAMGKSSKRLSEIMDTDVLHVNALDDQEEVLRKMADYDMLAIPVVDDELCLVGIITHDDILDVVVEEATEDAYRSAAVQPLEESYLRTSVVTLSWKRGVWLVVLFLGALLTTFALEHYEAELERYVWLVLFIPLVISTGGNSGNQSATLVITALNRDEVQLSDWWLVAKRELAMGLILGGMMSVMGTIIALMKAPTLYSSLVIGATLLLVVMAGTMIGSMLPLIFKRIGLDPSLMSNPFVAGIIDFLGIVIYMTVAGLLLGMPV